MRDVFIGSERLAQGVLTRGQLRWNYEAIFPDVYQPKDALPSLCPRIVGAWLWSGRNYVVAGRAAAALHGALWVDAATPIELIGCRGRPPRGIVVRNERIDPSELTVVDGMPVTCPARTALDLARHLRRDPAVQHLDALARATGVCADDVLSMAGRYSSARGLRRAEVALGLMDGGAQSPKETWLRLVLIDAGFPRPRTQIRVSDGFNTAFFDMGWDEPMIGMDCDGDQHQFDRQRYVHDIGRNELVRRERWLDLHVVAEHSKRFIVHRAAQAFARRGHSLTLRPGW
ncbi:hypothetical protein [Mycobacterium sp. AZCC_0083]|uniref:hypothetical protein n=1 Tax=Mycobacterium sp. AZCC_0083 TaxID=2735882 RepID=UPI001609E779|nr:hypothetical protein [Mycobacterium sp. AZCC_0083]MBB5162663.1 hypothetical protein [Mycobacterium sp. AZCC_0083]